MADIKLFVCCHKESSVPEHPLLYPIQVGAALADKHFSGFLYDDTGDNISIKNCSYCELTAQYWAWKNIQADYYGFFHYRRYLYPNLNTKRPYLIRKWPDDHILSQLNYAAFERLITQYDFIAPMAENMYSSVREHYTKAPCHHQKDLDLAAEILQAQHPEYKNAMESYLSNSVCYFGNIFIMKRVVFQDYCSWLFPVLEEFDRRADVSGYSLQEQRVNGYLAERLFGIYYTYYCKSMKVLEIPRVHFDGIDGRSNYKARLVNILLPPGSRARSYVKARFGGAHI